MNPLKFFFITLVILSLNCTKDSVLSDVEISDPSVIAPKITLTKQVDEFGSTTSTIEVHLFDKHNNTIKLRDGKVSVNGLEMKVERTLTNAPYYTISTNLLEVVADSLYSFIITLADGNNYYASIRTQRELNELNVPNRHAKDKDMEISWKELSGTPMTLNVVYYYQQDGEEQTSAKQINLTYEEAKDGKYTVTCSLFNMVENIYKLHLALSTEKSGDIDGNFRDSSSITSEFSVENVVNIF